MTKTPRRSAVAQPPARTALVVLGMHRSGTSALSGVLGQMGCDLPSDLMEPTEINVMGFFESNRITGLNEDLLASAGLRWFDFKGLSQDWYASPKAADFTKLALEALVSDFGQSDLFMLKDPRMCRLLPFWKRVFDQAGCAPAFVCTHRDPSDVAASLERWANYEPDYSLLLWLRHVVEAEAGSRGCRRVFTSYERLMTDWSRTIVAIGDGLGLDFPHGVETATPAVNAFLSAELQHFRQPGDRKGPGTPLPDWVAQAYEVLERWAVYGEDASGQAVFDQIAAGLAAAGNSFAAVAWRSQELRLQDQQKHKHQQQLDKDLAQLLEHAKAVKPTRDTGGVKAQTAAATGAPRPAEPNGTSALAHAGPQTAETGQVQSDPRTAKLGAMLEDLRAEHAALTQSLSDVTQQRDRLESEIAQRRSEVDNLHRKTAVDARTITALEKSLRDLAARNTELERRPEHDARHIAMMTQQLTALLAQQIDTRLAEAEALRAETGPRKASTGPEPGELAKLDTDKATRNRTLDQWILGQLERLVLKASGSDGKGG